MYAYHIPFGVPSPVIYTWHHSSLWVIVPAVVPEVGGSSIASRLWVSCEWKHCSLSSFSEVDALGMSGPMLQ